MRSKLPKTTRRRFLKTAAAAMAAPYVITSNVLGQGDTPAANERITFGGIGVGGRGSGDLRAFMGHDEVQVLAVCDVHARAPATTTHVDFRELIEREDIDAVVIGTPDHWHALNSILAMKQGKDVFCEKPLSLTFKEGRAMVNTARKYDRVFLWIASRKDGAKQEACPLPAPPILDGMALTDYGVFVSTIDGAITCLRTKVSE